MDFLLHCLIKIYLISSLGWVVLLVSTYCGMQFAGLKIVLDFFKNFFLLQIILQCSYLFNLFLN